jgi:hypothetical protein
VTPPTGARFSDLDSTLMKVTISRHPYTEDTNSYNAAMQRVYEVDYDFSAGSVAITP